MNLLEEVHLKENKYDRLIILLIVFQIFGVFGGALQPVRVLIVLLWPLLFFSKNKNWISFLKNKGLSFLFLWICYSIFSILWVASKSIAIKSISYNILHFSIFPLLFVLSQRANFPLKSIIKGWCLFFILTIPLASFEFITSFHLPTAHVGLDLYIGKEESRRFAALNFGNLNTYNLLLVYSMPFVFVNYIVKTKKTQKLFAAILIAFVSCFVILNSSRAALLCLMICFLYFIFFFRKKLGGGFKFIFFSSMILGVAFFNIIFRNILTRIESRKGGDLFGDSYREEIINRGLEVLQETFYIGVGSGNLAITIDKWTNFSFGHEYIAAHNLFLEIFVEYGIFIFILFLIFLYRIYEKRKGNYISHFVIGSSAMFYLISCVINSSYALNTSTWVFLFSLKMFALFDFNSSPNPYNKKIQ